MEHSLLSTVLNKRHLLLGNTACSVRYGMHSAIETEHRIAAKEKNINPLAFFYFTSAVAVRRLLITLLIWSPEHLQGKSPFPTGYFKMQKKEPLVWHEILSTYILSV